MSAQASAVEDWVVSQAAARLEVRAFNPVTGASKTLDPQDLSELLKLLVSFERAVTEKASLEPAAAQRWDQETLPGFRQAFAALGLKPDWYEATASRNQPLFALKTSGKELSGYSLRELLEAARAAGRSALGLPEAGSAAASPRDKLIYVIDDDDSLREMFDFILRREGFKVDIFADGSEALREIHDKLPAAPDLILLDLMMPQRNGYEIVKELQAGEASRIPVVVITARNIDGGMMAALRQEPNVADLVRKPLQPKDLARTVHRLLKTRPTATSTAA